MNNQQHYTLLQCAQTDIDQYLSLFTEPLTFGYIYGRTLEALPDGTPTPGKIDWKTAENKATGQPIPITAKRIEKALLDPFWEIGKRFAGQTNYCMVDIDRGSPFHPWNNGQAFASLLGCLEELGLTRPVMVRSSASCGMHLYYPLAQLSRTWEVATRLDQHVRQAGYTPTPGQLEVFPNVKGKDVAYNPHRLPMQSAGSGLVDMGGEMLAGARDLAAFLDAWQWARESNVLAAPAPTPAPARPAPAPNLTPMVPLPRPGHGRPRPGQGVPVQLAPLGGANPAVPTLALTAPGQTNETLRKLTNAGYEHEHLRTVPDLASWVTTAIQQTPGYEAYVSPESKADIETGQWGQRWAKARVRRGQGAGGAGAGGDHNAGVAAASLNRLTAALGAMVGQVFDTVNGLYRAVRDWILNHFAVGVSLATFYRHRQLWVEMLTNGQGRARMEERNLGQGTDTLPDKNEANQTIQTVNNGNKCVTVDIHSVETITHPPQTPLVDTPIEVPTPSPATTAIEAPHAAPAPIGQGQGKGAPTALLVTVGELVSLLPDLALAVMGLADDHELVLDRTDYPPDQWARLTAAILA
jgi:hypothetical protein